MDTLANLLAEAVVVEPLGGRPVACCDIKALAVRTHAAGKVLVADVTLTGLDGCPVLRLGADVAVAKLDGAWCVVGTNGASAQAFPVEPDVAQPGGWRAMSDAAQVVASYLRCHPRVADIRYPGLKNDPSFAIAARTLVGGFGPLVDYRLEGDDRWHRLTCTDEDARVQVMRMEHALGVGGVYAGAHIG